VTIPDHQFTRLMAWYAAHRDDEWEHHHGIKLEALDVGGWSIIVDTGGTELATMTTEPQRIERSPSDWLHWTFAPGVFRGNCGQRNMNELIAKFFDALDALAEHHRSDREKAG